MNELEDDGEEVTVTGETYTVRASHFYSLYVKFCIDNKYTNRLTIKQFATAVDPMVSKSRNKRGNTYKFEMYNIEQYLRNNHYWVEEMEGYCLID